MTTNEQVRNLLVSLTPNKFERAMWKLKVKLWRVSNERGVVSWLGDLCDTLENKSQRRRANSKKALKTWGPR